MNAVLISGLLTWVAASAVVAARPIHVVVWDEQQPEQKQAYADFLGKQIAAHLRTFTNFSVRSVNINEPDKGLSAETLDTCDVLIWWGHKRHTEIPNAEARRIVARIKANKMALMALHSAHWSEPFVESMRERAREDAAKQFPSAKIEEIVPPRFEAPKADSPLTPAVHGVVAADGSRKVQLTLPRCVFPSWRADGAASHMLLLQPAHPIARGLPKRFDIPHTEMYGEPFHVPTPDTVIFEERWDKGEHFRSACVWNVGSGKVFYFRPGHETYPVFTQPEPLRIVSNAVQWLGEQVQKSRE